MPKHLKRFLVSLLLGLTVLFSFVPYLSPAKAQTWYSQDPFEWYLKVYDTSASPANEIFGERYTAAQVQWVVYSFIFLPVRLVESVVGEGSVTCFIKQIGTGTTDLNSCTGAVTDFISKITKFIPALTSAPNDNQPFVAKVFDTTNRGMSGIAYTKNLLNKFSLVSTVKAQQGFGYGGISWIQSYWTGFRDISYALLVVVIIVFAFMIMFRVKLSPQTVISVQSALPKVIVAMILITFSYAIAGFAIDLMYVVSGLFALLLHLGFGANVNNAFGAISGTQFAPVGGFWVFFEMLGYTIAFLFAALYNFFTILFSGFNIFGAILAIVFVIMTVWVFILCLWYTFKIPYVLIKTLISLYLTIITAPIQILAGTLVPTMGFGSWFKRVMADVLVFPVTGLLFWFAGATVGQAYVQAGVSIAAYYSSAFSGAANVWIPEIVGSSGLGHNGGISGLIFLGISFTLITLIPKVPDMLKGFLLGEKFSFGMAIGEATGPIQGIQKTGTGFATNAATGAAAGYLASRIGPDARGWRAHVYNALNKFGGSATGLEAKAKESQDKVNEPEESLR